MPHLLKLNELEFSGMVGFGETFGSDLQFMIATWSSLYHNEVPAFPVKIIKI